MAHISLDWHRSRVGALLTKTERSSCLGVELYMKIWVSAANIISKVIVCGTYSIFLQEMAATALCDVSVVSGRGVAYFPRNRRAIVSRTTHLGAERATRLPNGIRPCLKVQSLASIGRSVEQAHELRLEIPRLFQCTHGKLVNLTTSHLGDALLCHGPKVSRTEFVCP